MRFMGSAMRMPHVQGGFREHVTIDASQAIPITEGLSLAEAAMAEPLSVCLHAANQAGPLMGKRVLVMRETTERPDTVKAARGMLHALNPRLPDWQRFALLHAYPAIEAADSNALCASGPPSKATPIRASCTLSRFRIPTGAIASGHSRRPSSSPAVGPSRTRPASTARAEPTTSRSRCSCRTTCRNPRHTSTSGCTAIRASGASESRAM